MMAYYARTRRREQHELSWGIDHDTHHVDAEAATKAVWDAMAVRGISGKEIARVTGLAPFTVYNIYHQKNTRITRQTERLILDHYGPDAHTVRVYDDNTLVAYDAYQWKLYSLLAQGWTQKHLRKMVQDAGRGSGWFIHHLPNQKQIQYKHARTIDWLVELIGDRRGPSPHNTNRLARRGVFPLIHYDDNGELIHASLTLEQLALWKQVR
jgi:hypothetical protein